MSMQCQKIAIRRETKGSREAGQQWNQHTSLNIRETNDKFQEPKWKPSYSHGKLSNNKPIVQFQDLAS